MFVQILETQLQIQYAKPKMISPATKFYPSRFIFGVKVLATQQIRQVKVLATLDQNVDTEVIRRTANFHPSVWGDTFAAAGSDILTKYADKKQEEVEALKQGVRNEVMGIVKQPSELLKFINAVQCLGLAFHFEKEIQDVLQQIYDTYRETGYTHVDGDLCNFALWFRLLRQQGFHIPSEIFNKLKNEEGNFKENLLEDVEGILGLYEAAHLGVHGEDVLDEALSFTKTYLKSFVKTHPDHPLTAQVIHALKRPIRKSVPWLETRHYMCVYEEDYLHNKALLKLAKLNFNLLQSLHKKELSSITKWWKELETREKLPFTRDRVVECYYWALAVFFEPQYSLSRCILTKIAAVLTIIDDIYDGYGTLEELELFTEAIERWDISSADKLPKYMKVSYEALLDLYVEIEKEMAKMGRTNHVHYAKEGMKMVIRGYFVEFKWFNNNYTPTFEEYMQNAFATSGITMLTATSFLGMEECITEHAFDWLFSEPKIVRAASIITRLLNDMVGHKFEQRRGHVASAVECYMNQHGVSEQQVYDQLRKQIQNAWKDINEECLTQNINVALLMRVFNMGGSMEVFHEDEIAGFTQVEEGMKKRISSVLIEPILV